LPDLLTEFVGVVPADKALWMPGGKTGARTGDAQATAHLGIKVRCRAIF
jgi:hypothetical protein